MDPLINCVLRPLINLVFLRKRKTKEGSMAPSIQVFGQPSSTDVARVLTCLFEKKVEFQLIRTDMYSKGNREFPEFLRLQDPSGKVTLRHGSKAMIDDSRKICKYICNVFSDQGNKRLHGPGALERASIERWLQTEEKKFDGPSSKLVFHLAFAEQVGIVPDMEVVETSANELNQLLGYYDEHLEEQEFLAGDCFTLADLSHMPNTHYLVNKSGKRGHDIIASRKNVMRWWKTIANQPSWKKVVQMQQQEYN